MRNVVASNVRQWRRVHLDRIRHLHNADDDDDGVEQNAKNDYSNRFTKEVYKYAHIMTINEDYKHARYRIQCLSQY